MRHNLEHNMTRKIAKWAAAIAVTAIALAILSGCAGSNASTPEAVARVGHVTISNATLEHWIRIQAVTDYQSQPTQPPPAGVIPDPPRFTACAAHLRAAKTITPTATITQLKHKCSEEYLELRRHLVTILITFQWLAQESAAQGIQVSEAEVKKDFAVFQHSSWATPAAFHNYLIFTGQSMADELLRDRMNLYVQHLFTKFLHQGTLKHFLTIFAKTWAQKTSCAPQYVVPNCKEYKGPLQPEARI